MKGGDRRLDLSMIRLKTETSKQMRSVKYIYLNIEYQKTELIPSYTVNKINDNKLFDGV